MPNERTEIEWKYSPPDFFEEPYRNGDVEYELLFKDGTVVGTLSEHAQLNSRLEERILARVTSILQVRQLRVHRPYHFDRPSKDFQNAGAQKLIEATAGLYNVAGLSVEAIVTDASGNIKWDTRAEGIAADHAFMDSLVPKPERSSTLRAMLESYDRAVHDPQNELVHLYEICDALKAHYRDEQKARKALNISDNKWSQLTRPANDPQIEQGRHRGKRPSGRRSATAEELQEARESAQCLIERFAASL